MGVSISTNSRRCFCTVSCFAPTSQRQRIPTVSEMAQRYGSAGRPRQGIRITVSKNNGTKNQAPSNNTWPRDSAGGMRRSSRVRSTNPARVSSVSIYGDGAFHSFTSCGAPGCQLCSKDGRDRQAAVFLSDRGLGKEQPGGHATADGRPGSSLILHTCEHCRMPFIPKVAVADRQRESDSNDRARQEEGAREAAAVASQFSSSGASNLSSDGGLVALEGSLAGCSISSSTPSSLSVGDGEQEQEQEQHEERPSSPLVGDRSRTSSTASGSQKSSGSGSGISSAYGSSSTSSTISNSSNHQNNHSSRGVGMYGTDEDDDGHGFCSGDCKMSYMLTNPAAVRRRRAAATARAAARAAQIEDRIEQSKRAKMVQQQQEHQQKQAYQQQQQQVQAVAAPVVVKRRGQESCASACAARARG